MAKLLVTARTDVDPLVRLAVDFLARNALRKGEFVRLTIDAVVHIGSAYWALTQRNVEEPLAEPHNLNDG